MIWLRNGEILKKNFNIALTLTSVCVSIYFAIHYSKVCSKGVTNGLTLCITTLVPSLFIFMVIASFISFGELSELIGKPFGYITNKIFGLPKICASTIILSLIGGYPVGARCTQSLYESNKINLYQAKKLSLIAVSSGPGFVINFVGCSLFNNKKAGIILFVSQLVGYFFVALLAGKLVKTKSEDATLESSKNSGFVETVEQACKATINMCAMVILFSAILSITNEIFKNSSLISDILSAVLEITTACNQLYTKYPLYVISALIGFGGICVHAQVFSALKEIKPNKPLFFLLRIIQGITAGVTTYILLILFPVSIEVFSNTEKTITATGTSVTGSIALILTAVCFLNSVSKINLIRR